MILSNVRVYEKYHRTYAIMRVVIAHFHQFFTQKRFRAEIKNSFQDTFQQPRLDETKAPSQCEFNSRNLSGGNLLGVLTPCWSKSNPCQGNRTSQASNTKSCWLRRSTPCSILSNVGLAKTPIGPRQSGLATNQPSSRHLATTLEDHRLCMW